MEEGEQPRRRPPERLHRGAEVQPPPTKGPPDLPPSEGAADPDEDPCPVCDCPSTGFYYDGTCTKECARTARIMEALKLIEYQIWGK